MQPNNTYYGVATGQNGTLPQYQPNVQPSALPPKKKHNAFIPISIILLIACIGLGVFIFLDKSKPAKTPVEIAAESVNDITIPLSEVKIESKDDEERNQLMTQALVGRTFSVTANADQNITFDDAKNCTFNYYRDPTNDYRKIQPSTEHTTYTVSGNTIKLGSGDQFSISDDYLIKTNDGHSKNVNTVYFDAYQYGDSIKNTNQAITSHFNGLAKGNENAMNFEKVRIDTTDTTCRVGDSRLTNADNYLCDITYIIYFDQEKTDKVIEEAELKDYMTYCEKAKTNIGFTSGGVCQTDYSIRNTGKIIVRINGENYSIIGFDK